MLVLDVRGVILGTPRVRPLSPLIEYDVQHDAIISPLSGYADHIRMWRGRGTRAVRAQRAHGVVQTVTSLIVSTVPTGHGRALVQRTGVKSSRDAGGVRVGYRYREAPTTLTPLDPQHGSRHCGTTGKVGADS